MDLRTDFYSIPDVRLFVCIPRKDSSESDEESTQIESDEENELECVNSLQGIKSPGPNVNDPNGLYSHFVVGF